MIEHERTAALVIASTEERRMLSLKAELEMMDHSIILDEVNGYSESHWGEDNGFHVFMLWCNNDGFSHGLDEEAETLATKHGCQMRLAEFVGGEIADDIIVVDGDVEGEEPYDLGEAFYLDAKTTISPAW